MHSVLRFSRWIIHKLSVALLANAVTIGVPLLAFSAHITNPEIVKAWLHDSNTYQTVLDESLDLITLKADNRNGDFQSLGETLDSNPFVNSASIKKVISETITADFLEAQATGVIDGTYVWLDGTQPEPSFRLSLESKHDELKSRLKAVVMAEFADLPVCTPAELTPEFNLIKAQCVPGGIDLERETDRFADEFVGADGLFGNSAWTQENVIKREGESSGLTQQQLKLGQQAFAGLQEGPQWLLAIGAVCALIVFATSRSRYRGFSEVGNTIFSGSLFTFISAFILSRYENLITNFIGENDSSNATIKAARTIFEPLLERIVHDVASLALIMSGIVLLVGTFMVGLSFYLRGHYKRIEDEKMEAEWHAAAEEARIDEMKKLARRHPKKYQHLTYDPVTQKPLKASEEKISVHHARKIVRDPATKHKKISEIGKE